MKYLDLTLPTPAENLACDEQLLDAAERGGGGEVLRVWESPQPFVVVGYGNQTETEVNVAPCGQRGIPILRRCSGGGTVVQGPGCLSYALILNLAANAGLRNVTAANRFIMERHRAAIEDVLGGARPSVRTVADQAARGGRGADRPAIAVQGHTDLTLDGFKFSGNAQRRRRRFILFHGTFLLNFDLALVGDLLPLPSRQPCYRASRSHRDFLVNLDLPAADVKAALRRTWSA